MKMSVTTVEKLQNEDEEVDYVQVQLNRRDNVVIYILVYGQYMTFINQ